MSRENDVSALLQQYAAETGVRSIEKVEQDFVEVAQQLPAEKITTSLSETFRSEETPPFDQMVGESFQRSDPQQRAGVLKQLIDSTDPEALKPLIGNVLVSAASSNESEAAVLAPDIAVQLQPELVQQIAQEAEQNDPTVIDKISSLYAEDPALVKTLGGVTLSVALGKMADKR